MDLRYAQALDALSPAECCLSLELCNPQRASLVLAAALAASSPVYRSRKRSIRRWMNQEKYPSYFR